MDMWLVVKTGWQFRQSDSRAWARSHCAFFCIPFHRDSGSCINVVVIFQVTLSCQCSFYGRISRAQNVIARRELLDQCSLEQDWCFYSPWDHSHNDGEADHVAFLSHILQVSNQFTVNQSQFTVNQSHYVNHYSLICLPNSGLHLKVIFGALKLFRSPCHTLSEDLPLPPVWCLSQVMVDIFLMVSVFPDRFLKLHEDRGLFWLPWNPLNLASGRCVQCVVIEWVSLSSPALLFPSLLDQKGHHYLDFWQHRLVLPIMNFIKMESNSTYSFVLVSFVQCITCTIYFQSISLPTRVLGKPPRFPTSSSA